MNILITNDDGIRSGGISALVRTLSPKGNIYVCAPSAQRSGASQSISLTGPIYVHPAEVPGAAGAFAVDGTPADCTKVGIQFWGERGITFDAVYSGINKGSNRGGDTLYSGTVGAAMEGALFGIRSTAVSIDSHQAEDFSVAAELAADILDYVMTETEPEMILNINVPYIPREQIKGIRYTRLGERYYEDAFQPVEGGGYMLQGEPGSMDDPDMLYDCTAVQNGYVSITPMGYDYTRMDCLDRVAECGLQIRKGE